MAPQPMTTEKLSALVLDVIKAAGLIELRDQLVEMKAKKLGWFAEGAGAAMLAAAAAGAQKQEAGVFVGRVMRALAASKGDPERAAAFALKEWNDNRVQKALAASDNTAGGFLLKEDVGELIELLRPLSVVRSLNPTTVPLNNVLRLPKHTAGASGGWIGENQNAPVTQPVFGQVVLTPKKYASLVPISNDLIRRGGPQADATVRDDLLADVATSTDVAFIRGTGVNGQPKGLYHLAAAANRLPANATVNLANVTNDVGLMLQTMGDASVRMLRPGWIMEWRTWRYLITVRDGNGNLVFKPEMDGGTFFGLPFRRTSQIPRTLNASGLGNNNETELYLADFADVVLGEATQILLDTSDTAAYHDGSNVVAAFSLDQTVVRAILEVDLGTRHEQSIVILERVTWAA